MAEWKFGTVIDNGVSTILLIGQSDGTYRTTDQYRSLVGAGEWIGLTLANKLRPSAYGEPGDVTWVIGNISNWTVLDE